MSRRTLKLSEIFQENFWQYVCSQGIKEEEKMVTKPIFTELKKGLLTQ